MPIHLPESISGMHARRIFSIALRLLLLAGMAACSLPTIPALPTELPPSPIPTEAEPTPLPVSMTTFRVSLPAPLSSGETLYLVALDEVTGLALNTQRYAMQADDPQHYIVILPFPFDGILKYRYERQGAYTVQEHLPDGRAVRYRMLHVEGPLLVNDIISRWTDTTYSGPLGRISGVVLDANSGDPLPNILVAAGGDQSLTDADGTFLIDGLPPGTQNMVVYALDAAYRVYQQGAVVAEGSTTRTEFRLEQRPLVNLTFVLQPPGETPLEADIRLVGNLWQLGNTFANLDAGLSSVASRAPKLSIQEDGRYAITLTLPAGTDLHYKFTLGDGLWNAEHTSQGAFKVRQIIVPDGDALIEEKVDSWSMGGIAPISFDVRVPDVTPQDEVISIQFNPGFGWTEPLPMWPVSANHWAYTLFSPLSGVGALRYRYCRDDQCGSADDAATMGPLPAGREVVPQGSPQTVQDQVEAWAWYAGGPLPATVPNVAINPRSGEFITGVELQPGYDPTWGADERLARIVSEVSKTQSGWFAMTPTWTYLGNQNPVPAYLPGTDFPWPELLSTALQARNAGMHVMLFPMLNFQMPTDQWWAEAPRDFPWWVTWFDRYQTFLLHHADLAVQTGAEALVVGGDWLSPALPDGKLGDGSSANAPEDTEVRWRDILANLRSRYNGLILWALPFPQGIENPPPFLDAVDGIYLLWSAPLREASTPLDETALFYQAANLLDETLLPFYQSVGKPVVLGVSYPSAEGATTGCLPTPEAACVDWSLLSRPKPDIPNIPVDLNEQTAAYNAMLLAVNERDWISGFISRGFYPPLPLQDKSTSIHGKPASGVLWFWFPKLVPK